MRSTAATGAPSRSTASCTSRPATTAPSTTPSIHGLKRVEAGAQGPHKLARGYLPVPTYSAHWVANESLRDAVAHYLDHETREIDREIAVLERHGPFRQSDDAA